MMDKKDRSPTPATQATSRAVQALTIKARRAMEGLQGGAHFSPHLGASVEFAEHKKYTPGDDIRHIDWRAMARTDRYFVKQHQREVVLRCIMMLDTSPSMGYRGLRGKRSKLEFAIELLAAMAHVLVRQGDAAGLTSFASKTNQFITPRKSPDHLSVLMSHLAAAAPAANGRTNFNEAISNVADQAGRAAMIVLASDLWGATPETEVALKGLSARGHDIAIFHVLDPDEVDLPYDQSAVFAGMEGEKSIDVDPILIREDYKFELNTVLKRWQNVCGEAKIDFLSTTTESEPSKSLSDFAARRHGPRRRF